MSQAFLFQTREPAGGKQAASQGQMMGLDTFRLVGRLVKNGIRFKYLKWTGRPGRPQAVSLEITHDCIAQCIMCNIWKIPRDVPNLSVADWSGLLASPLFSELKELDITGGEPYTREDLPDLIDGICELRQGSLKSLKSIAITTNGFLTERVLEHTEGIIQRLGEDGINLVMTCAMDAIGGLHEKIRNHKDAWSKADRTIEGLIALRERFSNLIIGLKTTVLPMNIGELDKIAKYADSRNLFTIISPCIITEGRYLNAEKADELVFSREDIEQMIRFYRGENFQWRYHGDALVEYLKTGTMKKPCSCGFNYFFVRSSGELFLCPLVNISLGNIKETPVTHLFFSEKANRLRKQIGGYPQCPTCTEPGLERYSLPYEGFTYLWLLLKMGKRNFLKLHHHMGLDNYV